MIILEVGVVIDGLFEVLGVIVDKNSVLLYFIPIDLKEVHFRVLLYYFVHILTADLCLGLLFHCDLIHISTYNLIQSGDY